MNKQVRGIWKALNTYNIRVKGKDRYPSLSYDLHMHVVVFPYTEMEILIYLVWLAHVAWFHCVLHRIVPCKFVQFNIPSTHVWLCDQQCCYRKEIRWLVWKFRKGSGGAAKKVCMGGWRTAEGRSHYREDWDLIRKKWKISWMNVSVGEEEKRRHYGGVDTSQEVEGGREHKHHT